MSYDLNLWSAEPVTLALVRAVLPDAAPAGDGFALAGRGWIANIGASQPASEEDVPEAVLAVLPGVAWLTAVTIEPVSTPEAVRRRILAAIKALAQLTRGAVEDPQQDSVALPSGAKRFVAAPIEPRISLLTLNYWTVDPGLWSRERRAALLRYLARRLPEALPRRYGRFEPPRQRWDEGGADGFLDFMDDIGDDHPVIYTTRPCVGHTHFLTRPGWSTIGGRRYFRCGAFSLAFEHAALADPAWHNAVRAAWHDLIGITAPFAASATVLANFIPGRTTPASDRLTDPAACTPFWAGVPARAGLALALDAGTSAAWPAFAARATAAGPLRAVALEDWRKPGDIESIVGSAPETIRERPGRGWIEEPGGGLRLEVKPRAYPPLFPFPDPGAVP